MIVIGKHSLCMFLAFALSMPMALAPFALAPRCRAASAQQRAEADSHKALAKKQQALLQRTERLKSMMKELLVHYTKQEREDYVRLLKEGLTFLAKSNIEEALTAAWSKLNQEKKSEALAAQTKVLSIVEELLAHLLDRRSLEGLEKDAKDLEAKLAALDQLQKWNQALKQKRKHIQDLSRTQTEKKLEAELEKLAQEQSQMARESSLGSSSLQDKLERALGKIKKLRKDAAALDKKVQSEQSDPNNPATEMRQQIRRLVQRAIQSLGSESEDAKDTQEKLASDAEELAKTASKDVARLLKEAAKKFVAAAKELSKSKQASDPEGVQERADLRTQEGLTRLSQAQDRQRRQIKSALTRAKELARKSDDLSEDLARLKRDSPPAGAASRALEEAAKAMDRVEEGLRKQAPRQQGRAAQDPTQQDRKEAQEALAKAEDSLAKSVARMQERAVRQAGDPMARQKELREKVKALQSRLGKAREQGQISPEQEKQAGAQMQNAQKAMQAAEKSLSKGSPRAASRAQAQAAQKLQEAAKKMRDAGKPGPQQKQAMERLAEEQQKLQRDIQELAKRVNPKKNPQARRHLDEAAKQAQKAQDSLAENEPQDAEEAQQKTKEELAKARKELKKERDQYLSLRQEELLFKIADEVEAMISSQSDINRQTLTLMASTGEGSRKLSRGLRSQVRRLGRKEGELAERAGFLAENLAKEETLVFTYVLNSLATDLKQLQQSMSKRRPVLSQEVTDLQRETLDQLKWLLKALRTQIKQKKKERKGGSSNQGQNKKRLVPDKAELLLLRRLEIDVREQIQAFLAIQKELGSEFERMNKRRLNRMALKHAKISDLFKEFVESRGLSLDPKKDDPKKEEAKEVVPDGEEDAGKEGGKEE